MRSAKAEFGVSGLIGGDKVKLRGASVLLILVVLATGCSPQSLLLDAHFEAKDGPGIDMLRLVEAPPGHLSGSLVYSSLDPKTGNRNKDVTHDIDGSLYQGNVTLRMDGGTTLVGTLVGETLSLSIGNQSLSFQRVTAQQYQADVRALTQRGVTFLHAANAAKVIADLESGFRQLNTELSQYVSWGKQRINNAGSLKAWYAKREEFYTKCLDTIKPLAESNVPSWRWQECVLSMDNDAFYLKQQRDQLNNMISKNELQVSSLNSRITDIPIQQKEIDAAIDKIISACSISKDVEICKLKMQQLRAKSSQSPVDAQAIIAYRTAVPQVAHALAADRQTTGQGQQKLSSITQEADALYHGAH